MKIIDIGTCMGLFIDESYKKYQNKIQLIYAFEPHMGNFNYLKKQGFLLKPKTWCKIKFNTDNSILMVFCDREYEYDDYIGRYNDFLKIVKKKK